MSGPVNGAPHDPASMPPPPSSVPAVSADGPIVTGPFVLGWAINFVQFFVYYLLVTTLAVYAISRFAVSDAEGGLASSAFILGSTFMRLFAGGIVDAFRRRPLLLVVLAIGCGVAALYLVADSFAALVAIRLVHGATFALASTASMSLAQAVIPVVRRAEGTGFLALSSTVATAATPALGIVIVGAATYEALFWCSVATAACGLVLALFVREERAAPPRARRSRPARVPRGSLLAAPVVPIGVFMLLTGMAFAGMVTYLNGFAIERDLLAGAGLFFVAYGGVMIAGRFVLGRLQDRRGDNVVVVPCTLIMALACAILALATEDGHVVLAGALCGLGYGSLMPAAQAIAVHSVPPERMGTGIASLFLFTDIAFGLCPVLLGLAVTACGYEWTFAGGGLLCLVALVWYVLLHGRRDVAKRGRLAH